ncbi:hypothetical protein HZC31_00970 [Candidatus Woesearchaeota archaeon]|nr:hypothetical protein [Candidatus Woesearchaeota archaeon]
MDIGKYVGILDDRASKAQRDILANLEAVNGSIYGRSGIETALHYAGVLRAGAIVSSDKVGDILGSISPSEVSEFGDVRFWYAGFRPIHAGIVVDAEHVFHARASIGLIEPHEAVTQALQQLRGSVLVTSKDYGLAKLMIKYGEFNTSLF